MQKFKLLVNVPFLEHSEIGKELGCELQCVREADSVTLEVNIIPQKSVGKLMPNGFAKGMPREIRAQHLLTFCEKAKSEKEMMCFLQLKDRKNFRDGYLTPLLENGQLFMTKPKNTKSKQQRYQAKR